MAHDYYNSAKVHGNKQDYSKAIPYFEKIITYYPVEVGRYYLNLAESYYHTSTTPVDIEKAHNYFDLAKLHILYPDKQLKDHMHNIDMLITSKRKYLKSKINDSNN